MQGLQSGSVVKNLPANAGVSGWIHGLGRFPLQKEIANPLWYSCLGNPSDRGAWRATVQEGHKELDMIEQMCTGLGRTQRTAEGKHPEKER